MSSVVLNVSLILILVMIQGIFVAAELALVSLRESQVRQLAHRGKRGQLVAKLTSNPNLFLSVAQVGVTLSGFLAAAFGADKLSGDLAPQLERLGLSSGAADTISLVLITIVISYVSIVLGELTAKRLALQRAESVALTLAPLVDFTGRIARPVIWLLGVSTNILVRILGGDPKISREEVTNEEIRAMVSGSTTLGDEERRIVDDVFAAGERSLREVMVPRTEVDFLPGRHACTPRRTRIAERAALPLSRDRRFCRRRPRIRARAGPARSRHQLAYARPWPKSHVLCCPCRIRCQCCERSATCGAARHIWRSFSMSTAAQLAL